MIAIPPVTKAAVTTATGTQDAGLPYGWPPRGDVPVFDLFPGPVTLPSGDRLRWPAAAGPAPPPHLHVHGRRQALGQKDHAEQRGETQDRDDRREDHSRRGAKELRVRCSDFWW